MTPEQKQQDFSVWLANEPQFDTGNPRYLARLARLEDFPQIYDLLVEVYGPQHCRRRFDWLYLENPAGFARPALLVEKDTGTIVNNSTDFPWPVAKGLESLSASMGGDAATRPGYQRQGLAEIRRTFANLHPRRAAEVRISLPNAKSRARSLKYGRTSTFGPLRRAVLVLDFNQVLEKRLNKPNASSGLAKVANSAAGAWRRLQLGDSNCAHIEVVSRFDASVDVLTHTAAPDQYWCPYDSDFLNWRYFDHPSYRHRAGVAVNRNDEVLGMFVLRIHEQRAMLMSFNVAEFSDDVARALLTKAVSCAVEEECAMFDSFADHNWRFWPLLHRVGFVDRESEAFYSANCDVRDDVNIEANWQLLPGDSDVH